MKSTLTRPGRVLAMLGAGAVVSAAAAGQPTSGVLFGTPSPAPTRQVCFAFETIAQGEYSGFGYYCGAPLNSPEADPAADVAPPCYARVANPELQTIIRGECAWIDFWNAHTSNIIPPPPVPPVDFDRFAVIAVVAGPRATGCYDLRITQIVGGACGTTVYCRERVPCPQGEFCTDAITNPFHFVKVCRQFVPFERPVCFENRNWRVPCSLTMACADVSPDPTDP